MIRCGGGGGGLTDGGRILPGLLTPLTIDKPGRGTGGNGPRGAPETPAGGRAFRGKVANLLGGGGGPWGDDMSSEL